MGDMRLTWSELVVACLIGVLRNMCATAKGWRRTYGASADTWQLHIEGAIGEVVVAKFLNRYWPARVNCPRLADIGDDIEVRTRSKPSYELILHDEDADDRRFYLVTKNGKGYRVVGWVLGRDGKQKQFWSDPAGGRPAYFVPHCTQPKRFEDEYSDGATLLQWFYSFPARFPDKEGKLHKLPCYLHCGKDYCRKIEFHWL